MNSAETIVKASNSQTREYVTFFVGDMLLGTPIEEVEEINRLLDMTYVPHAPTYVRGVISLRGEVVTVMDLQTLLRLPPSSITPTSRNVIVHWRGQRVGLVVDKIADVVKVCPDDMEPPPSNIGGADGELFVGVHKLESQLLVVMEIDRLLAGEASRSS